MTIQIELSPDAAGRLAAEALARGVSSGEYARTLLQTLLSYPESASGQLTADEVHTMLTQIAEGSDKLPSLPTSAFTRESFYEDRP